MSSKLAFDSFISSAQRKYMCQVKVAMLIPDSPPSIVFVHGFTGHPKSTWTLEKAKVQKQRSEDDDNTRDISTAESSHPPIKFPRHHSFPSPRSDNRRVEA